MTSSLFTRGAWTRKAELARERAAAERGPRRRRGMRRKVFARDRGVCAICGCDTEKLRRVVDHAVDIIDRAHFLECRDALLDHLGFHRSPAATPRRHLWEADHIIPFIKGGSCHLSNLRTLCRPCHARNRTRP